jgi:hypothetical protein
MRFAKWVFLLAGVSGSGNPYALFQNDRPEAMERAYADPDNAPCASRSAGCIGRCAGYVPRLLYLRTRRTFRPLLPLLGEGWGVQDGSEDRASTSCWVMKDLPPLQAALTAAIVFT